MASDSLPAAPPPAVRAPLCLVSDLEAVRQQLGALLAPAYELSAVTPGEVLRLSAREREATVGAAVAALVDWSAESPAVILALKETARRRAVPLVALCGPSEAEHVAALVVGADDTMTRPLKPVLFQARLLAYRRLADRPPTAADRGPSLPADHDVACVGPLALDRTAQRFYISGREEELPPRAFDLMAHLMRRPGVCHTRDEILDAVWGIRFDTETNILDVQIYTLRRKLKPHGLASLIETVRGTGYRLVSA